MYSRPLLAIAFLAFAALSPSIHAEPPRDLAGFSERLRADLGVPGLGVAATSSRGLTAVGFAGVRVAGEKDPIQPEDRFHIGSLTKSMTATVAARLVERGVLGWDTTIEQADADMAAALPEQARSITLEQLLAHRAGLPDDRVAATMHMKLWSLEGPLQDQRAEAARLILSMPNNTEPGERMTYSNAGYIVAGWMLGKLTGEPWETLIQRELFDPLNMASAGHGPPGMEPDDGPQPLGHGPGDGSPFPIPAVLGADNPPVLGPAGRVHCSIQDLAAYARLHLAGLRDADDAYLPHEVFLRLHKDPEGDGYALGWGVFGEEGDRRSQHSGSNTRWLAVILVWPAQDLAVVVAMNAYPRPEPPVDILARVMEEIRPSIVP